MSDTPDTGSPEAAPKRPPRRRASRTSGLDFLNEGMGIIEIGGGQPPRIIKGFGDEAHAAGAPPIESLLAALMGGLPGDPAAANHPLLERLKALKEARQPFRPATKDEFKAFANGWQKSKLEIGDIVTLRSDIGKHDKWPVPGEQAIVSQVLASPYRAGAPGSWETGVPMDVALMFMENKDMEVEEAFAQEEGRTPEPPAIFEFLYDSRRLKKVGNIYK